MKIIAPGTYPEENEKVCPECGCRFKYYNSEVHYETTTQDEESIFGGFGSYKWIKCPGCGKEIRFDVKFTPYESWVDSLCDFFRNIFRRKRKDDKHDV